MKLSPSEYENLHCVACHREQLGMLDYIDNSEQ